MDLLELGGSERHPVYMQVKAGNDIRHYDFLCSMIEAALAIERPLVSQAIIKAINFHAIAGLHHHAGEYRSIGVRVGEYSAPHHTRVRPLMDDFVNVVNWKWAQTKAVELASFALWRLNHIHPFINGNGRTARAVCYFILCAKSGGLLPGRKTVPELLRERRGEYVDALRAADDDPDRGLRRVDQLVAEVVQAQLADA